MAGQTEDLVVQLTCGLLSRLQLLLRGTGPRLPSGHVPILDHAVTEAGVTAKSIRPRIRSPGLNPLANPILGTNPLAYPIRPGSFLLADSILCRGYVPQCFLLSTLQNQSYLHCYYAKILLCILYLSYLHARMQTAVNIPDFLDCYSWP